jgi:hypothetical protein
LVPAIEFEVMEDFNQNVFDVHGDEIRNCAFEKESETDLSHLPSDGSVIVEKNCLSFPNDLEGGIIHLKDGINALLYSEHSRIVL